MPVVAWLDEMGHFMHHDIFQTLLRLFRQLRIQPDVSRQRVAAALKMLNGMTVLLLCSSGQLLLQRSPLIC